MKTRTSGRWWSERRRIGFITYDQGQEVNFDYAINDCNDIIDCMASITIRQLPEATKRRLRLRAARNGRSMEQEAREILKRALTQTEPPQENVGQAIQRIFAPFGGVELQIPKREPIPESRIKKPFQ